MKEKWPTYPSDLSRVELLDRWNEFHKTYGANRQRKPTFPTEEVLRKLFDVIYHVSFLTEESRKLAVRLAFLTPEDCHADILNLHNSPMAFSSPRPCTPPEIMRLAPALDPTQSMIAVAPSESVGLTNSAHSLAIWGLLHVGEDWSRLTSGHQTAARTPPCCLTLSSFSPGSITATSAGMILMRMRAGRLLDAPLRSFAQGHIGRFLQSGAEKLQRDTLAKLNLTKFSTKRDEETVPQRIFYHVFENLVRFAAVHHHGASFVVVSDNDNALKRAEELITLKYRLKSSDPWPDLVNECVAYRRYFNLLFPSDGTNIFQTQTASIEDFKQLDSWRLVRENAHTKVLEFEEFVAGLSCVDGAVVLTTGLKVLGFGGEIVSTDSKLQTVNEAQNAEATELHAKYIDSFGTRHRSAFRLCDAFPDCVVFVVSQDGDARAVKKVGANVLLWDQIHLRDYSL
jgi:hypothetical protein